MACRARCLQCYIQENSSRLHNTSKWPGLARIGLKMAIMHNSKFYYLHRYCSYQGSDRRGNSEDLYKTISS